jgi:hypothetical protein
VTRRPGRERRRSTDLRRARSFCRSGATREGGDAGGVVLEDRDLLRAELNWHALGCARIRQVGKGEMLTVLPARGTLLSGSIMEDCLRIKVRMKRVGIFLLIAWTATAGEIAELHRADVKNATNVLQRMKRIPLVNVSTNHGITEIGIERSGCFGLCPQYTFIVSANGRCRYEGGPNAKIQGKKTGRVTWIDYHRTAWFLLELNFVEMENEYRPNVTDMATTLTTAVVKGQRKTISNYAQGGPNKLWAIEQVIDGMLANAQWDK